MKKIFKLFVISTICMISTIGCDNRVNNKLEAEILDEKPTDYKEAVKNGDYATAHELLDKIHDEYVSHLGWSSYSDKYFAALSYVYESEIRNLIVEEDDCVTKIIFMISEIPLDGEKPISGSVISSKENMESYSLSCQAVNKLCDKVLELAIIQKNEELAKTIITQYKDDILFDDEETEETYEVTVDDDSWFSTPRKEQRTRTKHSYTVRYSTESKDSAIKKLEESFGK